MVFEQFPVLLWAFISRKLLFSADQIAEGFAVYWQLEFPILKLVKSFGRQFDICFTLKK